MARPEDRFLQELGAAIKQARADREWSQSKLARMLDTTEKNVRNWENGHRFPSHPHYVRLCLLFGWPVGYSGDSSNPGYAGLADLAEAVQSLRGPRVPALSAATS